MITLHSSFWQTCGQQSLTLLALVDPLVLIPIFLKLTQNFQPQAQKKFTLQLSALVAFILIFCALVGPSLFAFLGLSISSLQIAGSIILLTMGIAMLMGQQIQINANGSQEDLSQASLVPLATPLLAGPASISYVMASASLSLWTTLVSCLIVSFFVALVFFMAPLLNRYLKPSHFAIIERLFGLLVMVMAIEGFVSALKQLFPILSH